MSEIFAGDINIREIIEKLEVLTQSRIDPANTLLFFDEIQLCPRAITSLRYFQEEHPRQAVIAAGSLLDFALDEISIPVGRVTYLHMYPLSFIEFLQALGQDILVEQIKNKLPQIDALTHQKLLGLVNKYVFIGGMPLAVKTYIEKQSYHEVTNIHRDMMESFRQDFSKYSRQAQYTHLLKSIEQIPKFVGTQIKYARLDPDSRTEKTKEAILLLERANIIQRVRSTSGHGLPLAAEASDKTFKAVFLDVGLMQTMCGVSWDHLVLNKPLSQIHQGALAEQFVGQELMACGSQKSPPALFYWKRETRASTAEVDYMIDYQGGVAPIEVKSSAEGRLRSLHLFHEKYRPKNSFVISEHPFAKKDAIQWMPFYAIQNLFLDYQDFGGLS